jgi:hypothetical protein
MMAVVVQLVPLGLFYLVGAQRRGALRFG